MKSSDTIEGAWTRILASRLEDRLNALAPLLNLYTDATSPLQILPDSNGVYFGLDVLTLAAALQTGATFGRDYNFYHALAYGSSPFNKLYYSSALRPGATVGTPQLLSAFSDVALTPFVTMSGGALQDIAFELTTVSGTGEKAVVGIYDNVADTTLYPGNLVAQGNEFNLVTTPQGLCVTAISATLAPGALYWLAFSSNTNSVSQSAKVATMTFDQMWPIIGMGSVAWSLPGAGASGPFGGLVGVFGTLGITYSATLPATFPAGALPAFGFSGTGASGAPIVGVSFSS